MKLTTEEKVLLFLLEQYQHTATNHVAVCKKDLDVLLQLSESDVIKALNTLEVEGKFSNVRKSQHNDLSICWSASLNANAIHYSVTCIV